jgi:hypothetical protein
MKRTPLKRVSPNKKPKKKQKISTLKNKLWVIASKRIKERDRNICFTSGKVVTGSNAHCGHGIPNSISGGRVRYHPKNLHVQSYNENINLGGNGGQYYQNQVKKYGQKAVDELYKLKEEYIKVDEDYYLTLIDLYTNGTWEQIEYFLESGTLVQSTREREAYELEKKQSMETLKKHIK